MKMFSESIQILMIILKIHLQHLHSSISQASGETSWDWEIWCPKTKEREREKKKHVSLRYIKSSVSYNTLICSFQVNIKVTVTLMFINVLFFTVLCHCVFCHNSF